MNDLQIYLANEKSMFENNCDSYLLEEYNIYDMNEDLWCDITDRFTDEQRHFRDKYLLKSFVLDDFVFLSCIM